MSDRPDPPPQDVPPILHIKKGAERDVPLYYDRLKRQALRSAMEQRGGGRRGLPFLRGGRFSLFPLLLLALGAVVVYRILPAVDRQTAAVGGLSIRLSADAYSDTVMVNLRFTGKIPQAPIAVSAVCTMPGLPDPLLLAGEIGPYTESLTGRMDSGKPGLKVTAEVTMAGVRRTLRCRVQRARP